MIFHVYFIFVEIPVSKQNGLRFAASHLGLFCKDARLIWVNYIGALAYYKCLEVLYCLQAALLCCMLKYDNRHQITSFRENQAVQPHKHILRDFTT